MYHELELFGELRDDYRTASIVQLLYNINRGKGQQALKLEECLLKFGEQAEKPKQTPQQQFAMLKVLAAMHANDATPTSVAGAPSITFASKEDEARWTATHGPVEPASSDSPPVVAEGSPTEAEQQALETARKAMQ